MSEGDDQVLRAVAVLDAVGEQAAGARLEEDLEEVADALERVADAVDAELDALRARVPRAVSNG